LRNRTPEEEPLVRAELLLFIHGLGGDAQRTWGRFPDLIQQDPELKDYELDFFTFPTSLFRLPWSKKFPKIQSLADALRTQIENRFPGRKGITLVCHSLGGLIGRKYLVEEVKNRRPLRVKGLLLYAVPNNGAQLASIATLISWKHNQLRQLCKDTDAIRDLSTDWVTFKIVEAVRVRYVVAALDQVVDEQSAREFWGNPDVATVADRGHRNVVKPPDDKDLSFLILKNFVSSLPQQPSAEPSKLLERYATGAARPISARSSGRYRVIGFDLDGTLLRGYEFSWTLVWNYLNVPEAIWKEARRRYLNGEMSYREWCEHDYNHMRQRGLRRQDFKQITSTVQPTKNLRAALQLLRSEGFVLAIISGGIDAFVAEKLSDTRELFDYICINKLSYDDQGIINGIEATPFDFEGKAVALEAICKRHGFSLAEAVFVGEAHNDAFAAKAAGLSIAYPPHEAPYTAAARVSIADVDLLKILDHVLA
jgi:HAD superfamily phosphoserine phosphatase-like hydrolase